MNWDTAKGNWTLFKGNVKLQWGKLTHDHLSKIAGRHNQLTGKMQKTYGATLTHNLFLGRNKPRKRS
jgi:uncharacterized protein YjbJ (UPF0337 family)